MKELEKTLFDSLQKEEEQDQATKKGDGYFQEMLEQRQRPAVEEIEEKSLVLLNKMSILLTLRNRMGTSGQFRMRRSYVKQRPTLRGIRWLLTYGLTNTR